jgi:hypothetical protein
MMENIDPVEYGKLLAKVESLTIKVDVMESDIKTLLELANKSKGGFWMGMTIASLVGGLVTWVTNNMVFK